MHGDEHGKYDTEPQDDNPAERQQQPVLRQGLHVRIVGLKGQPRHNGLEGTLGKKDDTTGRWAFRAGSTTLSVKEANFEPTGKYTMKKLLAMFAEKALAYQYHDPRMNNYVFERVYALAVSEGRDMLVPFLFDIFDNEDRFDAVYNIMSNN